MSEQIKYDTVTAPDERQFKVSTVRTLAGGGGNNLLSSGFGFDEQVYLDQTPWPYETMVFKMIGAFGQYHAPSATESAALCEHAKVVHLIETGGAWEGIGVAGYWGNPSTTASQWLEANPRPYNPSVT